MPEPVAAQPEEFGSLVPLPELPELLRPAVRGAQEVPGGNAATTSPPSAAGTEAGQPGADPDSADPDSADSDSADTDLDLVQSRPDAATAI